MTILTRRKSRISCLVLTTVLLSSLMAGCAAPVTRTVYVYDQQPTTTVRISVVQYGTVARIEVVDTQVGVTGAGAATGAVLGGALTSQLGRGGRGPRGGGGGFFPFAVIGIVAGALIGNQAEQQQARAASGRNYQIVVEFDDGRRQTYSVESLNGLHSGERVQVERGRITPAR